MWEIKLIINCKHYYTLCKEHVGINATGITIYCEYQDPIADQV